MPAIANLSIVGAYRDPQIQTTRLNEPIGLLCMFFSQYPFEIYFISLSRHYSAEEFLYLENLGTARQCKSM